MVVVALYTTSFLSRSQKESGGGNYDQILPFHNFTICRARVCLNFHTHQISLGSRAAAADASSKDIFSSPVCVERKQTESQ